HTVDTEDQRGLACRARSGESFAFKRRLRSSTDREPHATATVGIDGRARRGARRAWLVERERDTDTVVIRAAPCPRLGRGQRIEQSDDPFDPLRGIDTEGPLRSEIALQRAGYADAEAARARGDPLRRRARRHPHDLRVRAKS